MMCKTKKMNSFCSWSASKSLIKDQFPIFVENRNIQIAHFSIVTSLLNETSHSLAFSFLCCVCVRKSLKFMMRFFLFCSPTKRTTSIMICSTVCHSQSMSKLCYVALPTSIATTLPCEDIFFVVCYHKVMHHHHYFLFHEQ